METPESTIPRASKRRCLRRDKELIVCTPQNETSPSSFFPGSFLSPATRNAASHRSSSTARTSLSNAECGKGVERSVATPKTTTSPYKGAFPSAPRHVADDADMAKQQFALMQSLRDASQGSRSLANVLQEATDLALQTGDRQAELVTLAQNALKVMKNVNSGRNEKTPAEGTHSSFPQASPSLHHDRLVDFLRQRHALSAGCESRQGASLYPANDEERPQESPYREGQIIEGGDFLRLRADSQQGSWAPTAQGISHYETTPKARHADDTKNPAQPVETNSHLPSNPRDVLHLRTAFQSARSCRSPSPDRGSLRPHCVAGGNDNSAPSAAFQSAGGAPHHRAEPTLASFAPLLCSSPEALPTGLRVDASSRPVSSTSSPDVILQTLRTLISLTTPSAAPVVPCNFPVSTGPSERDLSAASAENLSALLRSSNAPTAATAATSAAGICATGRPDPCELQRGESPSTGFGGGVHPAAQNILYTLLMSCGTGQQGQTYAEREGACTGPSSARTAGRDTRQYSALSNQPGNHPSHSRILSTTQSVMSTPSHVRSSPSGARLGDFGNSSSSSAECRPGSCVAGQGYGQPQHEEASKDMKALGRVGINCSISGLLAKKSHSMDACRSASEDNAQTTPTHSSYNSLRQRGSLLIGADKEASPGGPRGSAGDGAGVSRGRNRTESLTRSDGTTKLESLTRSESTSRTGTAGRARGRYAATAAGGEALAPGSVGRGVGATAAGGAGGCDPENETGKPDVTLGGNRPHYHVAKQEWRVRYYLNGKRKMRTYSAKFYGYEAAHSMATDFAQYVDKNEALPHPVCKPVGLGGGRGAAALSAVMASRALSAAATARERSEHPGTPVAARYATTRHDSLTEQHPRPPHPWESSPAAAAAKSLEALRLACSAGAKATNCPPQQMHAAAAAAGAAAARTTGGGADTFSVDGEATPILTRLSGLNRSSTLHFQASATPSDEEHSPYYEHSISSTFEPDRESGSSQSHEAHKESALQQKYSSMHEQQTTTPSSLPAVDFASEMTLAHFLKSRKRRSPSACCVGGPSAPTSPPGAGVPPTVTGGVEDKSDRPLGGVVLTRGSCTPSAATVVTQSTTERVEEAKPAVIQNSTVGCNASVDMFFQGLQDREKVYLSKLFSSVWVPSADSHHPADVALVRDGDGSTRSIRSNSGSVAPAAPRSNGIPTAAATSQVKCALMLQKQETRCSLLQTHTPSTASYPENSSTSPLSVSRSNSYRTFAEAAATPHKASTCSLADEPLQHHTGKFSPSSAGLSGDEMGVWMREDSSESSRDTPGLTAGQTDFIGGGGRDGARAGAAASAPAATAAEVPAPAVLATTQTPTGVGNPVESRSENIAGLAPGHATAAMLAKTAMSQQMLDTVMLFDEFIRGFEKEFSAEQLQQERRAILAPAASLASEVSACLPSLASSPLANGESRKPSRSCDPASTLSSSLCRPTKEDAGDVVSRSFSYSSAATDTKDAAWLSREGSRAEEIPKQLETLLQTGTSLSTLPALSHASAGASVTHGVSRVVTGLRMHLGSSELLVLSRVLVELTSSTYVLVTILRATLASSSDIVQKHCEDLPPNAAETTHTHSNELSKDARLQQEAGEAECSTMKSDDQEGWAELQQKGPGLAPAATREHNSEVALQQQDEEERKKQQQEGIGSAEGSAKGSVASCNVAACGGEGTLNSGSSWERSGSNQAAKVEEELPAGTSRVERKTERETTVLRVLRASFNTEAGPAAEVTPSKTVAAEAAHGSGEDTEKGQTSRNELTVESAREETRPNKSSSFFSGPGGPADVCKQSPLQAVRKTEGAEEHLRSSAEPSSSTVADMSYGGSAEEEAVEILTGTERACEDLSAEQQHAIGCQRSLKVARGDCTAAGKEPRMFVSSSLQQKAASCRQRSPAEKGEEHEEQETKKTIARGPAETAAAAAAKQQHSRQSFAAGEGTTGEGESSTIRQTAQERELRQKTIRSQRLLPQGETDLYVQQRLLVQQQQQPPIRADNFSASTATKDVVGCSCTDSAAVLQSIVTLLQSQQRLVSVIRQLQGSLPQYLRLIIRVAGHCFLPFKLPPATYFIKKPGRTATESASDDSAAGPAAGGKPGQALNAAPPRAATKAREHQHSEQPPPKSHRGCSLDQGETMLRHFSGSIACAGKKASESRGVSFEADEVQAQKKEKMTSELQQHDKVKFCAELPERLSSFVFLSRQSSVAGFPVYGAATSASSTEVEYSCSESPGPPGVDAERKLSRETAEDETTVLSCAYQEASHCGAGRTETTGKKQWDVADGGSAVPSKAEARRHYTPDEEGEASETYGGAERTATSVGGASDVAGRTSAVVPYVEVPGGRVIQDEAELEVFLLRPFQPAVCGCQDRPCPCDRQHIADLIHMLYTLPRSCEDADTAAPSSVSAASDDAYSPPHAATAGATDPIVSGAASSGGGVASAVLSRTAEAGSPHAGEQKDWHVCGRTAQNFTGAPAGASSQEMSGSGSDLSDPAAPHLQQRVSLSSAPAADLSAVQEGRPTRSSSGNVRFKSSHSGITSSRTTSSGSSSSSSEPSVIGSDALMLVEESLRQVLFAEKLAEGNSGSASSTRPLLSASASPLCGSQTTGTPTTLLSAADTPGSASSCAGSPFQRGLSATATPASSLLREAACQSTVPAAVEEKRGVTGREGKATAGAATTTVKEEDETDVGAGHRRHKPTGFSSTSLTAVSPAAATLITCSAPSAIPRKVSGNSVAKKDVASCSPPISPLTRESDCLHGTTTGAGEQVSLTAAVSSVSGVEKVKEGVTIPGGDLSRSTATDGTVDTWQGVSSPDIGESKDLLDKAHVGTAETRVRGAATVHATAAPKQNTMAEATGAAENVEGDEEAMKTHRFEEAPLRQTSADATSASGENAVALGSAPATGAKGSVAAGIPPTAEATEECPCSVTASESMGFGEEKRQVTATEPTIAAGVVTRETAPAAASRQTSSGLASVAPAAAAGEKLQSDAQGRCQLVAATGEVDEDRHFSKASSRNKEQPHKGQVAAAVTARGATRSVEVSSTSCCVGEKPQQAREAERETGSVLSSSRETRREAADKERQNDFKCDQSSGMVQSAVGTSDEGDQSRALGAGAVCEKEGKDSRTLRGEASVRMERRETRCSLLQERQSLLLQERSAAFLNLSYPTVLASILPLQSLAHTIARLILHLHRQLICRFIAAHATILLDNQRGHGKPNLTPALLQHLVRQLVEADAGCADCNSSSSNAKSGGNSSNTNNGGSSCRSSRSRGGSGEESQNIGKSLRGVARVCRGHAVAAEQCGGASWPDVSWRGHSVPEAPSATIEASAKTAGGSGRLGSDSSEEQSDGLRKRSATTMCAHSVPAAAAAMQKIVEQQSGQGCGTVCDGSGSSRGGRGAGGAATELGRLSSPALYYASLLHSNMGDELSTSLTSGGTSPSIHTLSSAAPAAATRSSRADSSNGAEKEREEREGTGFCGTYADIVRPAVAAVGASPEPNAGQQARLSLSRESGGATAATAAVALQKSAVPAASCVSVEKAVASLPACAGDAARKTGCLQLSSADILERVVALSRPPSAERAGSACGLPSVEETAENVFDCKAADLSQFLIRAHAFYASRGAGEKSAAADSPAFKAEDTQRDDAADSRDKDDRSSLLAFPSSGEARSSNTGSRLY